MVFAIVIREELVGTAGILSTIVTHHVIFHVFIEEDFMGVMPVTIGFEGQMRSQISEANNSVRDRQF